MVGFLSLHVASCQGQTATAGWCGYPAPTMAEVELRKSFSLEDPAYPYGQVHRGFTEEKSKPMESCWAVPTLPSYAVISHHRLQKHHASPKLTSLLQDINLEQHAAWQLCRWEQAEHLTEKEKRSC